MAARCGLNTEASQASSQGCRRPQRRRRQRRHWGVGPPLMLLRGLPGQADIVGLAGAGGQPSEGGTGTAITR
eukprot:SM000016S01883  [mRNA]  locus=s16:361680:362070:- [translate_table: standard]